jgi:20S proteasome subunit alpha 3
VSHFFVDSDILLVEFATVGKTKDGKVYHHLWSGDEIMTLLKEHGLAKEEEQENE